jgi:hypothetical protein
MDRLTPAFLGELKDVIDEGADAFVRKPIGKVIGGVDSIFGRDKKGDEVE